MPTTAELQTFLRESEPSTTVKLLPSKEDRPQEYEICWKADGHLRLIATIEVEKGRATAIQSEASRSMGLWTWDVLDRLAEFCERLEKDAS